MHIQKWGEEGFIQYLSSQFPFKEPSLLGIGDDCAVIPFEKKKSYLITTDALIEGIHFLKDQISPLDLGYKTIAVNVSDIVAMGGMPNYAFLTISIPQHIQDTWLKSFIQGVKEACLKWNIRLLGGDTVGSKNDIFLNVTLVGTAFNDHIKYRNMAKPTDIICVTGYLGDSAGGLQFLQQKLPRSEECHQLIQAHFRPEPSTQEGIWLAAHKEVHAMMDISDGLNCDLNRLLKASNCGGIVETTSLPISKALSVISSQESWDVTKIALTGGEEYCLLLTIDEKAFKKIQHSFFMTFGKTLYQIGRVTKTCNLYYRMNGNPIDISLSNFSHFMS